MDKVGAQLPTIAMTAASLTLVFLGLMFSSYEGFETTQRPHIRTKYRRRGWLAFLGLLVSLLSVAFGLIGIGTAHKYIWPDYASLAFLVLWGLLIVAQAFISLLEI
jgi:hypothetical protein